MPDFWSKILLVLLICAGNTLPALAQHFEPHLEEMPRLHLTHDPTDEPLDLDRLTHTITRDAILRMSETLEDAARRHKILTPPTTVRLWKASQDTFVLEVGGGTHLGIRPDFVAVGGGSGVAYMGSLRIGEVALFQGYVDVSDGMRFYGTHDFNLANVAVNENLHLVFVYREGIRASLHEIAGLQGSLENQFGVALDFPTRRVEGVVMENIRLGAYGGGSVALDLGGGFSTRVAAGAVFTGGAQLIW